MKTNLPIRKIGEKGWFQVENFFYDELAAAVGLKGAMVYFALARYVDTNQYCFPSQETLASKLGVSVSTIKRGVADLVAFNIIHRQRSGKRLNNGYWLLDKSVWRKPVKVIALSELSLKVNDKSDRTKVKAHRATYNSSQRATNDTRYKKTHNNDLSENKKIGKISVNTFQPSNNREQIAKEIAIEFGESHMDYLLSILRTHGIEVIQRAAGLCRDTQLNSTLTKPAAYLNSKIRVLIFEQGGGGYGNK